MEIAMFKVGDRVCCINNEHDERYFSVGETGTVLEVHHPAWGYLIHWDGEPCGTSHDDRNWYATEDQIEPVEHIIPALNTKGHCATSGGLRGHSVGTSYPFSVVGGIDGEQRLWTVVNYETGEEFATFYTHPGFDACGYAHNYAQMLADESRIPF